MCSKQILGALLFMTAVFVGCSVRLNDDSQKKPTDMNAGGSCFSSVGDVMGDFSNGTLSKSTHEMFFDCIDKAVVTFAESTQGRNPDHYEPDEIGGFLNKYFLSGKEVNLSLIREALVFKTAFIGGLPDRISRNDLRQLRTVFAQIKELSGELRTIMPLSAAGIVAKNFGQAQFAGMMRTFIDATSRFGDKMVELQGPYSFSSLASLMHEIQRYQYSSSAVPVDHWTNEVIKATRALPPLKAILVGGSREGISGGDWQRIYRQGARFMAAYLRAQYYMVRPSELVHGDGLRIMEGLVDDFQSSFHSVIDLQPTQRITSAASDEVFETLHANGMLSFSPATARQAVRVVFGKLLGNGAPPEEFSINHESLNNFSATMRFLFEGARATEALFRLKHGDAFLTSSLTRPEVEAVSSDYLLKFTQHQSPLSLEAVNAVKAAPAYVRTQFNDGAFGVIVPKIGIYTDFSYWHMLKAHVLRSGNRLLFHAYGDPANNRITEAQFDALANDIVPILADMGLVQESLKPSLAKRLFEASLFLPSSDGDKGLLMSEAIEMESIILSTMQNANRVHNGLADLCRATSTEQNGHFLVPGPCFREQYSKHPLEVLHHVPGMGEFVAKLGVDARFGFFDRLSALLRSGKPITEPFAYSDTVSLVLMPYYVESIFSRFDRNRDGFLTNDEGKLAYPLFRKFIGDMATKQGIKKPKDHEAIFHFILGYRQLPDENVWAYIWRRYITGPKKYAVDRVHVVEIFAKLIKD